jgi:hypothetical protein
MMDASGGARAQGDGGDLAEVRGTPLVGPTSNHVVVSAGISLCNVCSCYAIEGSGATDTLHLTGIITTPIIVVVISLAGSTPPSLRSKAQGERADATARREAAARRQLGAAGRLEAERARVAGAAEAQAVGGLSALCIGYHQLTDIA